MTKYKHFATGAAIVALAAPDASAILPEASPAAWRMDPGQAMIVLVFFLAVLLVGVGLAGLGKLITRCFAWVWSVAAKLMTFVFAISLFLASLATTNVLAIQPFTVAALTRWADVSTPNLTGRWTIHSTGEEMEITPCEDEQQCGRTGEQTVLFISGSSTKVSTVFGTTWASIPANYRGHTGHLRRRGGTAWVFYRDIWWLPFDFRHLVLEPDTGRRLGSQDP